MKHLPELRQKRGTNGYVTQYTLTVRKSSNANMYFWLSLYGILVSIIIGKLSMDQFKVTQPISPIAHAEETKVKIMKPTNTPTPTPTTIPSPTPTGYFYDASAAIKRIWGKDANIGLAIASCESGINADKYHINTDGSIDFSVFQVNTVHGAILDPEENIRYAYQLYQAQGTDPWTNSRYCWKPKL